MQELAIEQPWTTVSVTLGGVQGLVIEWARSMPENLTPRTGTCRGSRRLEAARRQKIFERRAQKVKTATNKQLHTHEAPHGTAGRKPVCERSFVAVVISFSFFEGRVSGGSTCTIPRW